MKIGTETLNKLERYTWPGNVRELQHAIERAVIMSDARILKPQDFFFKELSKKALGKDVLKLDDLEMMTIKKALDKNQGNISKTALDLGLTRAALYRRVEKYGIQ